MSWSGDTINLRESVFHQLHDNYLESKGIVKVATQAHPIAEQKPQPSSSVSRPPTDSNAGSKDTNREYEVSKGMNVNDVDDEQSQQAEWRR